MTGDPVRPDGIPDRPGWSERRWWHEWPIGLVLAVVAAGLVMAGLGYIRRGPALIGAAGLLAAGLRFVLPEPVAGLLVVRRRALDVAILMVLGLVVIALTLTIEPAS